MSDLFYPTVDLDFILDHVKKSGKLTDDGVFTVGGIQLLFIKVIKQYLREPEESGIGARAS